MASFESTFRFPERVPGCDCVLCARKGVDNQAPEASMLFGTYKVVKINDDSSTSDLSADELTEFEQKNSKLADWNLPVKQTQWWKICQNLVKNLLRDKDSVFFKDPVDPIKLNIPDYPTIIRHPMDLGTINRKLNAEECEYTSPRQVINDVRTVFRNCYIYNGNATPVWKMGETLSRKFEEQMTSYAAIPPSLL